jgi:hypothetical protein
MSGLKVQLTLGVILGLGGRSDPQMTVLSALKLQTRSDNVITSTPKVLLYTQLSNHFETLISLSFVGG